MKNQLICGEFDSLTAGGSYINSFEFLKIKETWSKNPKFLLKLFPQEGEQRISFKVSLSRPLERWAEILERNKVGSMFGLYVFNYKENEDVAIMCDKDLLIQDNERNVMPVFKSDEI